jgi:tetratricopeptide (TPR) repeat protein
VLGDSAIFELDEAARSSRSPVSGARASSVSGSGTLLVEGDVISDEVPQPPQAARRDLSLGAMATVRAEAPQLLRAELGSGELTPPTNRTMNLPGSTTAPAASDPHRRPTLRQERVPEELLARLREAGEQPEPSQRQPGPEPSLSEATSLRGAPSRPGSDPEGTVRLDVPEATRQLAVPPVEATRQLAVPRDPMPTLVTPVVPLVPPGAGTSPSPSPSSPPSSPPLSGTPGPGGGRSSPSRAGESTVVLGERSLGALSTQQVEAMAQPAAEPPRGGSSEVSDVDVRATAVRQVFRGLADAPPRPRRERTTRVVLRSVFSVNTLVGALALGAVLASGWVGYSYYTREQHLTSLTTEARAAFHSALLRGRLVDFIDAEARLRARLDAVPTDSGARRARALVLQAVRYEFGGGPALPDGDWEQEALSATRQIESERGAVPRSALLLSALAQGDLAGAEQHLRLLPREPADDEYTLPAGLLDYLSGQVALLGGRPDEAAAAVRRAVERSPLPWWQRRLGFWLLRLGQEEQGRMLLHAALGREPELCGGQIDLAYARGTTGEPSVRTEARRKLQGLTEPPRIGPDLCGRAERARAAVLASELILREDTTARGQALLLLKQAQLTAPASDLVLREALAEALLAANEPEAAVAQLRDVLGRLPQRRSSRLLLARALLRAKRGHDALQALEPLLGTRAGKAIDLEALLLKARALLQQSDTLEARREVERVLESAGPQQPGVRFAAQLLLGEIDLSLHELSSARRVLEPLVQQLNAPSGRGPRPGREQQLDAQLIWARLLLMQQPPQTGEARALLEAVRTQAPERVEARLLLGRLLRELGVWSQAEQELTAALRADEQSGLARRELATLLLLRGDAARAREQFTALLRDEQDADLHILTARAQRLDGAPADALQTLQQVRRSRGEVTTKYDEALLAERARALLALGHPAEVVTLLRAPVLDAAQLRHPTLPALLARAHVAQAQATPAQRQSELLRTKQILQRVPPAQAGDPDIRLAVGELLLADRNVAAARGVLSALVSQLETVAATGTGEEAALRQQAQRLLEKSAP